MRRLISRSTRNFIVRNDEVHVWRLRTDLLDANADILLEILSAAERVRAARFKFSDHRRRYIAAHVALRRILARYLELDPSRLEFCRGAQGKPDLILQPNQPPLRFNLSHSHDAALIAVTLCRA